MLDEAVPTVYNQSECSSNSASGGDAVGHTTAQKPTEEKRIREDRKATQTGDSPTRFQFGLSTLLLGVTLVSTVGIITFMAPGLGLAAGVVIFLGSLGVVRRAEKVAAEGKRLTLVETTVAFFRTIGILIALGTAIVVVLAAVIYVALLIMYSSGMLGGIKIPNI